MADSDRSSKSDPRERIGMLGCLPPPPRESTKFDVLYKMLDVLSEKKKAISEEKAALEKKMDLLLSEEKAVLDKEMDVLSKILDAVS